MKKMTLQACIAACITFGIISCGGSDSNTTKDSSNTVITNTDTSMKTANTDNKMSDNMASATPASDSGQMDKTFVTEAANGGMMEVEMSKLAMTNAASAKIKEFGKMMVADHTKANNELKALAGKKNIAVPPAIDDKGQKHLNDMKGMKGADFDKAYVDMMVDDHKTTISKFEEEMTNTKDADFKTWTSKTLPTLRQHGQKIMALQQAMK